MNCRVHIQQEKPTKAQVRALQRMAQEEMDKLLDEYNREVQIIFAYWLYSRMGWKQKGLNSAIKSLGELMKQLSGYEMGDSYNEFICKMKLEDAGINIKEMLGEEE